MKIRLYIHESLNQFNDLFSSYDFADKDTSNINIIPMQFESEFNEKENNIFIITNETDLEKIFNHSYLKFNDFITTKKSKIEFIKLVNNEDNSKTPPNFIKHRDNYYLLYYITPLQISLYPYLAIENILEIIDIIIPDNKKNIGTHSFTSVELSNLQSYFRYILEIINESSDDDPISIDDPLILRDFYDIPIEKHEAIELFLQYEMLKLDQLEDGTNTINKGPHYNRDLKTFIA